MRMSAVASTVSGTVKITAAAPHVIIIIVADAVVAIQVNTRVQIRVLLVGNLVVIGFILDRLAMARVAVAATAPSANARSPAQATRPLILLLFFGARSVDSSAGTVL